MPQNEYIEEAIRRHGRRIDHEERTRKRTARMAHKVSHDAKYLHGLKAKQMNRKRQLEKISMKKKIRAHDERDVKEKVDDGADKGDLPTYLLDREEQRGAKALSSAVKEKRKDKAARWAVPLPKVRAIPEDEIFRVQKSGKRKSKAWKRMITKMTFVPENFTRVAPKYERFIRPSGLRIKKAHVTHPELKTTFQLPILGVKRNPQSPMYTGLGVLTKGTVIEVDTSILGVVTPGGKVVISKYAQVTNNPENDGCVNAVLLISN